MSRPNIKQIATGFIALAFIVGVFSYSLEAIFSRGGDIPSTQKTTRKILSEGSPAFVEDSEYQNIIPKKNLTGELAERIGQGLLEANPDGPMVLNNEIAAAIPNPETLIEDFYKDPSNYGDLFLLSKRAAAPSISKENILIDKHTSELEYQKEVSRIWSEQLSGPGVERILGGNDPESYQTLSDVLAQSSLDLKRVSVPEKQTELHLAMLKLIEHERVMLDFDATTMGDPLREAMLVKMQSETLDGLFEKFNTEFAKNWNGSLSAFPENKSRIFGIATANAVGVPVVDLPAKALTWKEFFKRIAMEIVKDRLVHRLVQQVIGWIQGNGAPQFITDWKGFFKNTANDAVGQVLDEIAPELCQSFGPMIKVNFIAQQGRSVAPVKCTLDRVVDNVQNFYDNFQRGGWVAYGAALEPTNNYFGSMITVNDAVLEAAERAKEAAKSDAESASGYKSTKRCVREVQTNPQEKYAECMASAGGNVFTCSVYLNPALQSSSSSQNCAEEKVTTPGKTLSDIIGQTMPAPMHRIVNADDVAALVTALVNSALNKLIKSASGGTTAGERNAGLASPTLNTAQSDGLTIPDPCRGLAGESRMECQKNACEGLPSDVGGAAGTNYQAECQSSLASGNTAAEGQCDIGFVNVGGSCEPEGGNGGSGSGTTGGGVGNIGVPSSGPNGDLSGVVWDGPNISSFSATANLSASMRVSNGELVVDLNYDKANIWPEEAMESIQVVGNAWIFVYRNGAWHAGTWEWLRPGQTQKDGSNLTEPGVIEGALRDFSVQPGETYYLMVSTPVRGGRNPSVEERSNIVAVQAPQGGYSSGGITLGDGASGTTGSGQQFSFFGRSRFQVFVSYFDAMRASDATLDSDFAYLRRKGVGGIRIFPNWWNGTDYRTIPGDTLMASDGSLRSDRLAKLKTVLDKAQSSQLIVDITFAKEVADLGFDEYRRGIENATRELSSYRNVIFDLQNERDLNGRETYLTQSQVDTLNRAVKAIDSSRLTSASMTESTSLSNAVSFVGSLGLNFVSYHDSRSGDWYNRTGQVVSSLRAANRPVYLSEPAYMSSESSDDFLTAIRQARSSGAAAWTFHTENSFDLRGGSFESQLSGSERAVLDGLSSVLGEKPTNYQIAQGGWNLEELLRFIPSIRYNYSI